MWCYSVELTSFSIFSYFLNKFLIFSFSLYILMSLYQLFVSNDQNFTFYLYLIIVVEKQSSATKTEIIIFVAELYFSLKQSNFFIFLSVKFYFHFTIHFFSLVSEAPKNPCEPSPCGPYSICRMLNEHAICSCQRGYIGSPPSCRPECIVSADCPQDKACTNQRCIDPCPGTCGINARCQVVNHNPICSCTAGLTGDPFIRCVKEESKNVLSTIYLTQI